MRSSRFTTDTMLLSCKVCKHNRATYRHTSYDVNIAPPKTLQLGHRSWT